jgi:hypothetical protein
MAEWSFRTTPFVARDADARCFDAFVREHGSDIERSCRVTIQAMVERAGAIGIFLIVEENVHVNQMLRRATQPAQSWPIVPAWRG